MVRSLSVLHHDDVAPADAGWELLLDAYLSSYVDSQNTRNAYGYALREAFGVLGVTHLDHLNGLMLARYRAWVLEQRWAPGFMALKISALRSFLRWSRALGAHSINGDILAMTLRVPTSTVVTPYQVLTEDEARRLIAGAEDPLERALVLVMLGAGLRVSEVVNLDCEDVLPGTPTILRIRQGKGRKDRLVPLREYVAASLGEVMGEHGRGPIFTTPQSGDRIRRRRAEELVARMVGRAGILPKRITPHSLRHTFAIRALRHGADIVALSKYLGHSDLGTTMRYVNHLSVADLLAAVPPEPCVDA